MAVFSVVFHAMKIAQATKGQGWMTEISPPFFCTDVKSRTCEDLASCDRSLALFPMWGAPSCKPSYEERSLWGRWGP